jgi:uncharacterized phage-associated protein
METASKVAKWILAYNRFYEDTEDAPKISNMKLQKLLYYTQGCFLAAQNRPLFGDEIAAWPHGPVVESVYNEYKGFGSGGIVLEKGYEYPRFERETTDLLMNVHRAFAWHSASKLRNMTHSEDPWRETPQKAVIPKDLIAKYFREHYEFEQLSLNAYRKKSSAQKLCIFQRL